MAINKAQVNSIHLSQLMAYKSKLGIKRKLLLYKFIILSTLLYRYPIWGSVAITRLKKLQVFQNQQFIRIVNVSQWVRGQILHDNLEVKPILDHIKDISAIFFQKTAFNEQIRNELLQDLPVCHPTIPRGPKSPSCHVGTLIRSFSIS
ncbi:hypothetical protein AVEN_119122-1 [Araneus ventricosus]|uniref:RNA-directed DNA polymerase from mobile element jockey n=1 Tax=Araneus ventricosus TaxID=182803 RepID=A0A4Y2BN95_ARAVE|nr:hypothetical protein AVEN_119122-1 [Araneus ventricosus]